MSNVTDKLADLRAWGRWYSSGDFDVTESERMLYDRQSQLAAAIEALRTELIEARGRLTGALGPGAHIDIAHMEVIECHVDQRITTAAPMLGEK